MANFKCVRYKKYESGAMKGFADLGVMNGAGKVVAVVLGFKLMDGSNGPFLGTPDLERTVKGADGKKVGNGVYDKKFFFGEANDTDEVKQALADEALRVVQAAAMEAN